MKHNGRPFGVIPFEINSFTSEYFWLKREIQSRLVFCKFTVLYRIGQLGFGCVFTMLVFGVVIVIIVVIVVIVIVVIVIVVIVIVAVVGGIKCGIVAI